MYFDSTGGCKSSPAKLPLSFDYSIRMASSIGKHPLTTSKSITTYPNLFAASPQSRMVRDLVMEFLVLQSPSSSLPLEERCLRTNGLNGYIRIG